MKRTRKNLSICMLSLVFLTNVKAQTVEDKKNQIGIQAGVVKTYHKDLIFSPLNNKGNGYEIGINYARLTKQKHILFGNFNISESTLKSQASEFFRYGRYLINTDIGFLFHIPTGKENLKLNIGGSYQNTIDLVDYNGLASVTFFNYHGLAINGQLESSINDKHNWGTALNMPIFTFLARPPYSGWDKFMVRNEDNLLKILYRTKAGSLNQFFAFDWQLFYKYQLSKKMGIKLQYELQYKRTKQPETAIIATNQTSIELTFKF